MQLNKQLLILLLFTVSCATISAQSMLFNSNGGSPHPSAMVEIESTTKGFLMPRMSATNRLAIPSPAAGLMVFQTDGFQAFYYFNGTDWDTINASSGIGISSVSSTANSNVSIIRDIKASNINGGACFAGGWMTRELNSIKGDMSFVNLSNDTIILSAGTYLIEATAPAFEVDQHQIRLFNILTNTVTATGSSSFSDKFATTNSTLSTVITVPVSGEKYFLEHRCSNSNANGFGIANTWGENIYTQIKIQKL